MIIIGNYFPWSNRRGSRCGSGAGKGKMTNSNYVRVSKSQQDFGWAQIFLRNWTSSSVFGLIDIRFHFLAPNTLSDILIIFWLGQSFLSLYCQDL